MWAVFFDRELKSARSERNLGSEVVAAVERSDLSAGDGYVDRNVLRKYKSDQCEIRIVHHNVQSIGNCLNELEIWMNTTTICDLLCVTEHWKSIDELSLMKILNYKLVSSVCRESGQHGGAAVFARDGVDVHERADINNLSEPYKFECAGAEAIFSGRPWIVAAVYRTNVDIHLFFEKMNTLLTICFKEGKPFIIAGDFNIDLKQCTKDTLDFVELVASFNAIFTIDEPTRITTKKKSCIDNIIIPDGMQFTGRIQHPGYSDHTAQSVVISVVGCDVQRFDMRRIYSDHNISLFLSDLRSLSWQVVYESEGVDRKWDAFLSVFTLCFESRFPLQKHKLARGKKKLPWITHHVEEMRNKVSLLQLISSTDRRYKQYYDIYRRQYNSELNQAKNRYFLNKIKESNNRSKATWGIVNGLLDRKQVVRVLPDRDPETLSNDFNDYFLNIASELLSGGVPCCESRPHLLNKIRGCPKSFFLDPVSEAEILDISRGLNNSRSFGHDNVPLFLLKICIGAVLTPLCHIINCSFQTGTYPQHLKIAEIIPLYKKGDKNSLNSYRAISLQSSFSKLFERAIYNRLIKFCMKYNLISPSQHGFLPGRGTDTALFDATRYLSNLIEGDSAACGVFLDLSKAFDCLDHGLLLDKLEAYGVRGIPLKWMKSYLGGRRQLVRVTANGQLTVRSELRRSEEVGVPQGSILGPFLFVLYINDFGHCIDAPGASFINYADDATVVFPCPGEDGEATLRVLMGSVESWLRQNKMVLNVDKTECVLFKTNRSSVTVVPFIIFNGSTIYFKTNTNMLGVTMDSRLNFRDHINDLSKKISKFSYGIRVVAKNTSRSASFLAYYGIIYPLIRYCIVIWGGSTELERVFVLQKRVLRIILHLEYRHSCRGLFKQHSLLTAYGVYIFECLKFVRKHWNQFVSYHSVHEYPTRHAADFVYPGHRYTHTERLPHYAVLKFYNLIPTSIRSLKSYERFKKAAFKYVCDLEPYSVGEFINAR